MHKNDCARITIWDTEAWMLGAGVWQQMKQKMRVALSKCFCIKPSICSAPRCCYKIWASQMHGSARPWSLCPPACGSQHVEGTGRPRQLLLPFLEVRCPSGSTNPDPTMIFCSEFQDQNTVSKIIYFLTSPKKKITGFFPLKGFRWNNICVENIVNMLNWQAVSKALHSLMFCA